MQKRRTEEEEKKKLLLTLKGKENITLDGQKILLYANIGNIKDLAAAMQNDAGGIGHFAHQGVQADRVGCRMRGLDLTPLDAVDHRRNQPGLVTQNTHQVVEQRRGRGLAVGARDDHRRHVLCKFTQQVRAELERYAPGEIRAASAQQADQAPAELAGKHCDHDS